MTTLTYSLSWMGATGAAAFLWYRETRGFGTSGPFPGRSATSSAMGPPEPRGSVQSLPVLDRSVRCWRASSGRRA